MKVKLSDILESLRAWINAPILTELRKVENKMSQLSDAIKAVSDGLAAVSQKLAEVGTSLAAEIQQINDKIAAGSVTPEDLTNLSTIATGISGIATSLDSLNTQIQGIVS